ncbi:unnamed protein product [Owenia fusiformis]|uniref:Uncharacterized protein n=1 Tax=Owenia fusiformis TaxID=6347 RepID=A0A8S4Q677_OWEFU|nr:unnamed protein product [Owenia fusiformis]
MKFNKNEEKVSTLINPPELTSVTQNKHSCNFISTAAIHEQEGGKQESAQLKTLTKKQLIETNKNIYRRDAKKKQLSDTFLRKLNSSFPHIQGRTVDNCTRLISEIKLRHDVQYFVFRYSYEPSPIDVTLLSHLTLNRGVHRIAKILAQWPGPASISVFGTDGEIKNFLNVAHSWKRNNVGIHVVYQRNATHYPVNFMRNIALYGAHTSHIWMIDADFTPNKDAYQLIRRHIRQCDWNSARPALVTPAFETNLTEGGVPDNKIQLLEKLNERNSAIHTFRYEFYVLPDVFIVHEPHKRILQPDTEQMCLNQIGHLIKMEILAKRRYHMITKHKSGKVKHINIPNIPEIYSV